MEKPLEVADTATYLFNAASGYESPSHGVRDPSVVRHDPVQVFPDSGGSKDGSDFVGMIVVAMPCFRLDIEDIFAAGVTERLSAYG